ncbi:dTDP-4-dehydrorhamnose reductase [Leptolyngbya sp. CCY15150]|uniref:dTDP-4-dehydrorhamnose reductase n=1 Tax=Leptolyngbya sp. CCY15150 TaxID=2767772 RepID=UPI00194FF40E|nr:dTDP-4-dehydrorhamnose reductase [Leptolyngbya sp. CCY15150]
MRILLTGIDGQLGSELQPILSTLSDVTALGRSRLDLSQPDQIRQVMQAIRPDVVVNAAAYTGVDTAEREMDRAIAINGTAPTILAEEAQKLGSSIIHVSTDYVFDGSKNTPYLEDDPTGPKGAYGQSKLAGELGVSNNCDRHLIVRTAWVYGAGGKGNFVKTMLRLGAEREELRVVMDQVGCPTWTGDLAQAIAQLIPYLCAPSPTTGILHYTNSGAISWYDFAVAIVEEAAALGFPLTLKRVVPITTADYPTPAQRPAYSVLSGQKAADILGHPAPHWRASLRKLLHDLAPVTASAR